jgi:MFS family permease
LKDAEEEDDSPAKANLSRLPPLFFLIFAEAMIAVNQTNISAIYLPISNTFNQGIYGLGILTAALFLSYGFFEIPGGILAIKSGPKKLAVFGFALNMFGVIASSFSPTFSVLTVLRFVAGIGAAFAFPTLLVLIVQQLKEGSEGLGSGWTVGWTSLGTAVGLLAWPELAQLQGWRPSIQLAGAIEIIPLVGMILSIREDKKLETKSTSPSFQNSLVEIKKIVTSKRLLLIGLVLFGAGEAFGVYSNFIVYFLEGRFGTAPAVAGFVGALSSIVPIFASPIIGKSHDKIRRSKVYFLMGAIGMCVGVGIVAIHNFDLVIVASLLVGFGTGVFFTLGFALAKRHAQIGYESLSVAWVDTFSLMGTIVSPIVFSFLVLNYGYDTGWITIAIVSFVPIVPLFILFKEK